jgi:putative ABC transport system permease protein
VRLRGAIVTVQVALSVTLIAGAGLLIKSFALLRAVNPGFDTAHVLGFNVGGPKGRYDNGPAILALQRRVVAAASVPGVVSVSFIRHRPLNPNYATTQLGPDAKDPASDSTGAIYQIVAPRLFATLGVPVIQGREFTDADIDAASVPSIVSTYTAKKYWPNGSPIGHELTVINGSHGDPGFGKPMQTTVVGVVGDVKKEALSEPAYPVVYVPLGQPGYGAGDVIARTSGDPTAALGAIRRAVAAIDPDLVVSEMGTVREWLAASTAREQFVMTLLTIFSGVALTLAALGLYGVIAYSVTQRTPELGIRMALGAQRGDVVALVAGSATVLVGIGLALGAGGAFVLGRTMRSLLYGIGPSDPGTLLTVLGVLAGVAAMASYVPARRAARVDPVVALRAE